MAWVTQIFGQSDKAVSLYEDSVLVEGGSQTGPEGVWFEPENRGDAHAWALMLRRAARRLEEIGKGLPDGR